MVEEDPFGCYDDEARKVIATAVQLATTWKAAELRPEHILLALLEQQRETLRYFLKEGYDIDKLNAKLRAIVARAQTSSPAGTLRVSEESHELFRKATQIADREPVTPIHILAAAASLPSISVLFELEGLMRDRIESAVSLFSARSLSSTFERDLVSAELSVLVDRLHQYVRANQMGMLLMETSFVVSREPLIVLTPPAAYVDRAKLRTHSITDNHGARSFSAAPTIAIESTNHAASGDREIADTISACVRANAAIWVVDSPNQRIVTYRPDSQPQTLGRVDTLADERLLPGFHIRLTEVFV